MDIGRALQALDARLRRVENSPRLSHAAIDNTSVQVRDSDGSLRGLVGVQADGTTAVNVVNGPPPPQPTDPVVTPILGGVNAAWDGRFTGGATLPLDWARVEVHASTTAVYTPDAATLVGTIETAQGATVVVPTQADVYVRLLARNTSGTASTPSATIGPYGPTPVVADDILDGIVTTVKLADDAVTQAKVAVAAIGSTELAAGAVLEEKLAAAAVTTAKMADAAVSTLKLADDAVTKAKVAVGAIGSDELGLGIGNLAPDPSFEGALTAATIAGHTDWTQVTPGNNSATALHVDCTSGATTWKNIELARYPVLPGERHYLGIDFKTSATFNGSSAKLMFRYEDAAATVLGYGVADKAFTPGAGWDRATAQVQAPTGTKTAVLLVEASACSAGEVWFDNAEVSTLVVGGKVAAGVITATEIAALTIQAGNLAADSVTAGKVAADAITARELAASSVTASEIAANAVTTAKLAAGAVTANEIAANTITAGNLAANSVTATQIAAGAVQTAALAADSVAAGKIAADVVTAREIAANTVTASEIAANTIVAGNLAAGSVDATALSATAITGKTITGGTITGTTITGGTMQTASSGQRITLNEASANKILVYNSSGVAIGELSASGLLVKGTGGALIWIDPSAALPQLRFDNAAGTNTAYIQMADLTGSDANLQLVTGSFTADTFTDRTWRMYAGNDFATIERIRRSNSTANRGGRMNLRADYAEIGYMDSASSANAGYLYHEPGMVTTKGRHTVQPQAASSSDALSANAYTGHTGNLLRLQLNAVDKFVVDKDGNLTVAGIGQRTTKRRTSDATKTSTTTPATDTQITFTVDANATYVLDGWLKYSGPGDFLMGWTFPSGTFGEWCGIGNGTTVVSGTNTNATQQDVSSSWGYTVRTETTDIASTRTYGGISTNTYGVFVRATIRVASTGGTFALQWAQGTSSGTATTLYTDSYIRLEKVS